MLNLGDTIYVQGEVVGIEKKDDGIVYKIDVVNKDAWGRPERVEIPEKDLVELTRR